VLATSLNGFSQSVMLFCAVGVVVVRCCLATRFNVLRPEPLRVELEGDIDPRGDVPAYGVEVVLVKGQNRTSR